MTMVEIFAANLRAVRVARGISQSKLANSSGLSAKYIGRLEGGKQSPTLTTVASLADALSIEPSELIAAPIPLDRLVNLASG
jgi:transcriptional regulator with XRE-family HTH domain